MRRNQNETPSAGQDNFLSKIPSYSDAIQQLLTSDTLPDEGWYYAVSGKRFGPIPMDKLRNFLLDGALPPEAHVYCHMMESWRPAYKVTALWRPPASDLPSQKWYVNESGRASNDYTTSQIWDMIEDGRVTADTQLYSRTIGQWKSAQQIMIFASAWQTPTAPPTPPSQMPELPDNPPTQDDRLAEQYEECEQLLTEAETHIEEWNCEEARDAVEEAADLDISQHDQDFRDHIRRLTKRINEREDERERKRKEVNELITRAREQLSDNDTLSVFETILKLREMSILEYDRELTSTVDALQKEAEQAEREMVAQREDATEAIDMARQCLDNWELEEAEQHLNEAQDSPACQFNDDLRNDVTSLEQDLAANRKELRQARSQAQNKLDEAEQQFQKYNLKEARSILEKLDGNTAIQADEDVAEKRKQLQSKLRSREQQLETERQQVPDLLSQAQDEIANWNLETARSLLNEASDSLILNIDSDLKSQVDSAVERLETTADRIQNQRDTARKKLANAERQCAIYNFDSAENIISEVEDLEAAEKDSTISERLDDLKKRLTKKRNQVQQQRSRIRKILNKIHKALDNWNIKQAKSLFERLGKANLNRIDPEIRSDIRESQSRLKEIHQKTNQQTQKARSLLQKADTKIQQKRFSVAEDTLERLEDLEIIAHRPKLLKRAEAKRDEIASEKDKWEKLHKKSDKLLNTAHHHIKTSNFSAAQKALKKVRSLGTAKQARAIKSRLNHLNDRLRQKQKSRARALLKKADNLANKSPDEASDKLKEVAQLSISRASKKLRKEVARIQQKIAEKRSEQKEIENMLDRVDQQIQKNNMKSARQVFNKILDAGEWQKKPEIQQRLQKQKQQIMTKIQDLQKARNKDKKIRHDAKGGRATSEQKATASSSDADLEDQDWYYCAGDDREGPVSFTELKKMAQNKKVKPDDYVWAKSLEAWAQAQTVDALAKCFD